jgi:hypothetical protein
MIKLKLSVLGHPKNPNGFGSLAEGFGNGKL